MNHLDDLIAFINAREAVRLARERGSPPPWSPDPILQRFRFCNINREHDAVTLWIAENVRAKPECAAARWAIIQLAAARIFNHPPVLMVLLPILDFHSAEHRLRSYKATGAKLMRAAYMMPTHGGVPGIEDHSAGVPIEHYWIAVLKLLGDLLDCDETVEQWTHLSQAAELLLKVSGFGEFLANQICADLRYVPELRDRWDDWSTFVLAGPGTRRGLNRLRGRELTFSQSRRDWSMDVRDARMNIADALDDNRPPWWEFFRDPNNLSNVFCEFDKYCRARDAIAAGDPVHLRKYNP
jgi:hypothetical protein